MNYHMLDHAHITRFLENKFPDCSEVAVTDIRRSWPGNSRETWFVTATWTRDGKRETNRFVFRVDPPTGPPPHTLTYFTSLREESEIYRILQGTPIPVPPMLWHENDPEWQIDGREFFVRGWVDGAVFPEHLHDPNPEYDRLREAVVKELMEKLALLHTLDWEKLGFDAFLWAPRNPHQAAIEELDRHLQYMRAHRLEPFPAFLESMLSIRDTPPPPPSRLCLRKENVGLGEEVWEGSSIVAMCDWETMSLGDPALDLAVAMITTGYLWDIPEALSYYEKCSGIRIEPERLKFYTLLWTMRCCVASNTWLLRSFQSGGRPHLARLGLMAHSFQSALARAAGF